MRLHADWHQLHQLTLHSAGVVSQHAARRSHVHRATFYGGMSWRARTSVNEATTLAKAVHRWQARRAWRRCASHATCHELQQLTSPSALTLSHHLHAALRNVEKE